MKGVAAKCYTMFDQRGEDIDETHAKATISYYGITASGIKDMLKKLILINTVLKLFARLIRFVLNMVANTIFTML